MSLIHYELYNQDVVAEAAFENYINKLVKKVAKLYSEDKTIKINTDITCKELNPELTINIGLILVELVSNSIRHGFRNKKEGHIEICFDHNNEVTENVISVKDNGIGFGQSIDPYEANTLGFEIVTSLCKQIEGHFTILKEANHTLAIIRF